MLPITDRLLTAPGKWIKQRPYTCWTLILFGFAVLTLILFFHRFRTPFSARIQTKCISFYLGHWQDSAGIFNSDASPVDLRLNTPCQIRTDTLRNPLHVTHALNLLNVKLLSLDTQEGLHVMLSANGDSVLYYTLSTPNARSDLTNPPTEHEMATILLDQTSKVLGSDIPVMASTEKRKTVEWRVYQEPGDNSFEFSLRLRPVLKGKSGGEPPAIEQREEAGIPLAEGGPVTFSQNDYSQIVGSNNWLDAGSNNWLHPLELPNWHTDINERDVLILHGLHFATIQKLSLNLQRPDNPQADSLDVTLSGQSDHIVLKSGGVSQELATVRGRLIPSRGRLTPNSLAAIFSALGSFGTVGYLIVYMWKEVPEVLRKRKKKTMRRRIDAKRNPSSP